MSDIDTFTAMLDSRRIDHAIMPFENGEQTVRLVAGQRGIEGYPFFYADFSFDTTGNLTGVHIAE